ncbi:MAG: DegV family protein [Candidatus Izemoplasmatales bacterium]|nr:DegV family protein [Candidatus Izemoplasmatales bacterium]
MDKIGVAVCGNSGIDYLVHDKGIRKFRSLLKIGNQEYEDFVEINSDDFYSRLEKNPDLDISTSQTSTGKILEMYEEMKEAGYNKLLVITISKQLSGTYQNAVLAAKMIDIDVVVYDSYSLTYIEALMAMTAKIMADENKPIDEIIEQLDKIKDNNHVYITVNTLKYLIKNGRLSGVAGALGSLLKLRPLLHLSKEGKVDTVAKIRTTEKAREELKRRFLSEVKDKNVIPFIVYTNNMEEMLDLKDELETHGLDDVLLIPLTPVVGCHAGPGTMGVGYIEKV